MPVGCKLQKQQAMELKHDGAEVYSTGVKAKAGAAFFCEAVIVASMQCGGCAIFFDSLRFRKCARESDSNHVVAEGAPEVTVDSGNPQFQFLCRK
jgi:hypothetical protein